MGANNFSDVSHEISGRVPTNPTWTGRRPLFRHADEKVYLLRFALALIFSRENLCCSSDICISMGPTRPSSPRHAMSKICGAHSTASPLFFLIKYRRRRLRHRHRKRSRFLSSHGSESCRLSLRRAREEEWRVKSRGAGSARSPATSSPAKRSPPPPTSCLW